MLLNQQPMTLTLRFPKTASCPETLVVCMGEFGRSPLVALEPRFDGATPDRKHWAAVYSIVFAGAGVTPDSIVGKSDRHA